MGKGGCDISGARLHDGVVKPEIDVSIKKSKDSPAAPWWSRGGMHVNEIGMGINIVVPLYLFVSALDEQYVQVFLAVLALNISLAFFIHKMRTVFCALAVPAYMTSLILVFSLPSPGKALVIATILGMAKVGICMSACLHRYASHAAFKCGPATQLFVSLLGCLANQGGPIWWASQHRCHHKYCDLPRDPHAAVLVGTEQAFSFFQVHRTVEEEFAPKHCDNWYLRIIDTFSFATVSLEMLAAFKLFGYEGLFIAYVSGWVCQTITLWFNVANHPEDHPGTCKASDLKAKPSGYYPAFLMLDMLYPVFAFVVGEGAHEHHHKYSQLAKRDSTDLAYYLFIAPLEAVGLIWDVKGIPE